MDAVYLIDFDFGEDVCVALYCARVSFIQMGTTRFLMNL